MAEVQAVKVERSRARGHVASNTLTAWTVAIHWRARFCLSPPALSNIHTQSLTKSTLTTLRFFEASARRMTRKGTNFETKRRRCGIFVVSDIPEDSKLRQERHRSSLCRPAGAGMRLGVACYKDVTPDGVKPVGL